MFAVVVYHWTRRVSDDAFFKRLTHEIAYWPKEVGMPGFKKKALIVQERLLYRGLPLMSAAEKEHVLSSEIDIKGFAEAVESLYGLSLPGGSIKRVVKRMVETKALPTKR